MLDPGRGTLDRAGRGFEHARNYNASPSTRDIRVELEGLEERRMNGARHRRVNPPVGCPLARFLAIYDRSERGSLLVVGALVDYCLTLAVALKNRPGPAIEECCAEAIEHDVAEMSFVDANGGETAAVSVRGTRRLELARTRVIAVAIADLDSFDVPINVRHGALPRTLPMSRVSAAYGVGLPLRAARVEPDVPSLAH
jgi:hypothetical protein